MKKSLFSSILVTVLAFGLVSTVSAQNQPPVVGVNGFLIAPNVDLWDDFCGNTPATTTTVGQLGWDITTVVGGSDPVAAVASVANHPCLITLTDAATATDGVAISLGHGVGTFFPGNTANWQSEFIEKITQVATGSYRTGFGTVDAATAIPTNGIYARFLNGTDTFINLCSDTTSSETCGATTITPTAGDWIDIYFSSTVTGTITMTVVDITTPATSTVTVCASSCTVTATPPVVVLSPFFNIVETGSSVADTVTVDYWNYAQILVR